MSRVKKEIYNLWDSLCWLKQKSTRVNNCFITCSGKIDGAGAQIQAVLSTILFAQELGIKYVHIPFKKISHNIDNDKSYERRWESFANLGFKELAVGQINSNELEIIKVSHPRQVKKINNTLYVIPDCHKFADRFPNLYLKLIPDFQKKYAESKDKPDLYFDPSKINIAMHMRRGDVTREDSKRYTSNSFVLSIIKELSSVLSSSGRELVFHIYSQGCSKEFLEIEHSAIIFHLNESPFTTFHHMVSADVLVMAKSSFSYSAALFSKGVIIYLPFWHKPMKNWIIINKNGCFDKERFKDVLRQKTNEKLQKLRFCV